MEAGAAGVVWGPEGSEEDVEGAGELESVGGAGDEDDGPAKSGVAGEDGLGRSVAAEVVDGVEVEVEVAGMLGGRLVPSPS